MRLGKNQKMLLRYLNQPTKHGLCCLPIYDSGNVLDVMDDPDQRRLCDRLVERGLLSMERTHIAWYRLTVEGRRAANNIESV